MSERLLDLRNTAMAALVAGSLLVAGCSSDNESSQTVPSVDVMGGSDTSNTNVEQTSTTLTEEESTELIDNIFNGAPEAADFDCIEDGKRVGSINIVKLADGTEIVPQILPLELPVDSTKRDEEHRVASNALGSPITADLTDKEAVEEHAMLEGCEQPAVLAAYLTKLANMSVEGVLVADVVDWLAPYASTQAEYNDIATMLANPYTDDKLTPAEVAANVEATLKRMDLAEKVARAVNNFENQGVMLQIPVTREYALSTAETAQDVKVIPEFVDEAYTGNIISFRITKKGGECIPDAEFDLNIDDHSPVDKVEEECIVTPPTEDTVPPEETTPTTPTGSTNPDKVPHDPSDQDNNTNMGSGGTLETGDGSDDSNDSGYGNGDSIPVVPPNPNIPASPEPAQPAAPAETGSQPVAPPVVAAGTNEPAPSPSDNVDPATGGVEGDPGMPQD